MFREMRRKRQKLSEREAEEIMRQGQSGVLAVSGDDGYPYAVPVNYVYQGGNLYFHCALEGHKLDGIKKSDKVSFCVIDRDEIVPEAFTDYYRSAIAFGRARVVSDDGEKERIMDLLMEKYTPDYEEEGAQLMAREWGALCVVAVAVEHLSGKAAREMS